MPTEHDSQIHLSETISRPPVRKPNSDLPIAPEDHGLNANLVELLNKAQTPAIALLMADWTNIEYVIDELILMRRKKHYDSPEAPTSYEPNDPVDIDADWETTIRYAGVPWS